MKYRQGLLILLISCLIYLCGCRSVSSENSGDHLFNSIAKTVETAYQRHAEHLTEFAGDKFVDFPALQRLNPEIYAWLYIPGTSYNAPIAQSESADITYYQTHGADREESIRGCLYTHFRYSSKNFTEPVSVIYAKTLTNQCVFDGIEETYRSREQLQNHQDVYVFTADTVLHYQVFCSTEYSDVLISREFNGFESESDSASFLQSVFAYHTLRRQVDEHIAVSSRDQILVLTSKLTRDEDQRFLVLAKMVV